MSYFIIYLITMLSAVKGAFIFITAILGFAFIVSAIALCDFPTLESRVAWGKRAKTYFFSFIFSGFLTFLIPTTNQALIIAGGGATVEVLQSEQAKEIGGKSLKLLNQLLDERLEKNGN